MGGGGSGRNGIAGDIRVAERGFPGTDDSVESAAVGIGIGDEVVGLHPVMRVIGPLLGRKKWQQCRERVERETLARGQEEVFANDLEGVANRMLADDVRAARINFHTQVMECENGVRG